MSVVLLNVWSKDRHVIHQTKLSYCVWSPNWYRSIGCLVCGWSKKRQVVRGVNIHERSKMLPELNNITIDQTVFK